MDEDRLPFGSASPEAAISTAKPRRHRHVYAFRHTEPGPDFIEWNYCACGAIQDPAASRRGKSSDRLGKDQERRIERWYGPRKVGEYGDAVDLIGRDFMWQAKATRQPPPLWLSAVTDYATVTPDQSILRCAEAMKPLLRDKAPLVIRSYVHVGVPTRDWIWVPAQEWVDIHGWSMRFQLPWLVMSGGWFLEQHGRDEA